jgi:hypothetical protein
MPICRDVESRAQGANDPGVAAPSLKSAPNLRCKTISSMRSIGSMDGLEGRPLEIERTE